MIKISTRARLAAAAVAATAVVGVVGATAGPAAAADPMVDARAEQSAGVDDSTLWFIRAHHTGKAVIESVVQSHLVQRYIPPQFNPLYTGQVYYFHYESDLQAYEVESFNGGCLDIFDGLSTAVGAKLAINQCDGTLSQRWESVYNNGGWTLRNELSGLTATVDGWHDNAPITQRYDTGAPNQRFDMPMF